MTIIHKCDHCGHEGRVMNTPHGFHCEDCYELIMNAERETTECPQCGRDGVGTTGICYPCENAPAAPTAILND
ncbi:hypothetical protein EGJ51_17965 [Pseudomonas fulva]|nr:hypothetical protein EGJ51_17965 [Pseudomonas fulva]